MGVRIGDRLREADTVYTRKEQSRRKPYSFIRIYRSVVVNISAVEEIQPRPMGEYKVIKQPSRVIYLCPEMGLNKLREALRVAGYKKALNG